MTPVLNKNGNTLSVGYDSTAGKLVFEASVATGQYLAIGFNNSGMTNTDIIAWEAGSTTSASQA